MLQSLRDLRRRSTLILSACLVTFALAVPPAVAQTAPADAPPAPATAAPAATAPTAAPAAAPAADAAAEARLANWRATLDQVSAALARPDLADPALGQLRLQAATVRDAAAAESLALAPRIKAAETRLGQLTQPDAADAHVESELVKRDRELETRALAALRGIAQQAEVQRLRAGEIIAQIADRRRSLFTSQLFERRVSILNPQLWMNVGAELPRALSSLTLLVEDWVKILVQRTGGAAAAAILLLLAVVGMLFSPLRHRLLDVAGRVVARGGEVPALKRALAAAAVLLVNTLVPVLALLLLRAIFGSLDVLPPRIDSVLRGATVAVGFFAFSLGLSRGLLAPGRPDWRLVTLPDTLVDPLMRWIVLGAALFALGLALLTAATVLALPLVVSVALQAVIAVATAVITAVLLRTLSRAFAVDDDPESAAGGRWRWLIPLGWLVVAATIAAALTGYLALSWFLATQIVWTAAVLGTLVLLLVLVDESISAGFRSGTDVGRFLAANLGLSYAAIGQIGVLLSGVIRLLLIIAAVLLVVGRLGVSSSDMSTISTAVASGLSIGGLTLSPTAILGALVLFTLGVAATRGLQHWLDARFLPRTRLDVGLKTSIRTSVGYVGTIAAGMVAFAFAGLNLQNIAIVAGALSVGIGFGLQSIVNNFVSGLILLAERPIKVGDWIVVGTEEGTVKRINVRSTEIETFDRATVIVPNSSLISGTVKNWMHHDLTGRVQLSIGADYDADPERVMAILVGCARAHPQVLAYPQPSAQFTDFGTTALQFSLSCFVGNVGAMGGVRSDLRIEILKQFRAAGITIPHT